MIMKYWRFIAIKSLRQDKIILDHAGATEIMYALNPEMPDFILPVGLARSTQPIEAQTLKPCK